MQRNLVRCAAMCAALASSTAARADDFWKYWGDGKAELDGYALVEPRYGAAARRDRGAIFVTEDFSDALRVKADPGKHPKCRHRAGDEAQPRARLSDRHLRLQHDDVDLRAHRVRGDGAYWRAREDVVLVAGMVRPRLHAVAARAARTSSARRTATSTARRTRRPSSSCRRAASSRMRCRSWCAGCAATGWRRARREGPVSALAAAHAASARAGEMGRSDRDPLGVVGRRQDRARHAARVHVHGRGERRRHDHVHRRGGGPHRLLAWKSSSGEIGAHPRLGAPRILEDARQRRREGAQAARPRPPGRRRRRSSLEALRHLSTRASRGRASPC